MSATAIPLWKSQYRPHGALRQLAPRIWEVTGRLPQGNLTRNMALYAYEPGKLLVHSAVVVDDPTLTAIRRLGEPTILVVPNCRHRLDAPAYVEKFPQIQVVCPEAARERVEKVVKVHATSEEVLPKLGIRLHLPDGIKPGEHCLEVEVGHGNWAWIVSDLLFNLPDAPGWDGWLFKHLGSTGFFGITAMGRWTMLRKRSEFKRWLVKHADRHDLTGISLGHGDSIFKNFPNRLAAAAERL